MPAGKKVRIGVIGANECSMEVWKIAFEVGREIARRLILVLAAALIIGYFVAPREIRDRAFNIAGSGQTVVQDGVVVAQGDERPFLWKSGIEVMKHNPLAGVGLLNFRKAYPQYLPYTPKKSFNHAHNNFIHLGAETGVPGLLAFIAMLIVYFGDSEVAMLFWFLLAVPFVLSEKRPSLQSAA